MFTDDQKRVLARAAEDIRIIIETGGYSQEEHSLALQRTVEIDLARWFDVERVYQVDRNRIHRGIKQLEKRGLVAKRPPMTGSRRGCLQLTPAGYLAATTLLAATEGNADA